MSEQSPERPEFEPDEVFVAPPAPMTTNGPCRPSPPAG